MNIVVMRHGEAETNSASDEVRNLTDYGRLQAGLAGECLRRLSLEFDQVWVSPYSRAVQTADAVLRSYSDVSIHRETTSLLVPEASPAQVADRIAETSDCNVLIVSHQPLVSALVGILEKADSRMGPPMSPASMALLTADTILAGCCRLQWVRHAPYDLES
jgi:phosphohistidine phosphatase